ncbi:integrase, partial [Providencia manganoxydans]
MNITVDYHQTNQKTNTGKTLKPWPILVDHYIEISGRLEVAARLQQRVTAIMRYAVQSGLIDYNP